MPCSRPVVGSGRYINALPIWKRQNVSDSSHSEESGRLSGANQLRLKRRRFQFGRVTVPIRKLFMKKQPKTSTPSTRPYFIQKCLELLTPYQMAGTVLLRGIAMLQASCPAFVPLVNGDTCRENRQDVYVFNYFRQGRLNHA